VNGWKDSKKGERVLWVVCIQALIDCKICWD